MPYYYDEYYYYCSEAIESKPRPQWSLMILIIQEPEPNVWPKNGKKQRL